MRLQRFVVNHDIRVVIRLSVLFSLHGLETGHVGTREPSQHKEEAIKLKLESAAVKS